LTEAEIVRELLQIIDKLINLLTINSTSDFVFDDPEPVEDAQNEASEYTDCVAGYAISTTWELEDEIIRDPELPDIGDPEE
jgi:hypothetical protein